MHRASGAALTELCGLETAQGSGCGFEGHLHLGDGSRSGTKTQRVCREVGREVSHDCEVLARQLAPSHSVLRAPTGDSESDLHDQRDRVAEHVAAQSDQSARLVSQRRGGLQAALPGATQHRQEMDHAGAELESRAQPLCDCLRKPLAGGPVREMIDEMHQPGKKSGLWKRWKNKPRFPTVPTAPTAADISNQKAAKPKPETIVYTKHLTLPSMSIRGTQTRTFVYDSLKQLSSATNPESGMVSYQYDNNGNLAQKTDPRPLADNQTHVTITYNYDALNRPTSRTYNDGTPSVSYYYDNANLPSGAPANFNRGYSAGRLVATTSGSGSSNGNYNGYDPLGRILRHVQQTDGVNYLTEATYYSNGVVATETYPAFVGASDRRSLNFTLDSAGRLASLSSSATSYAGGASVANIGYSAHGGLNTESYGNSLVHSVGYNTRLQPNQISLGTSGNATSMLSLVYNYGTTNIMETYKASRIMAVD